LAFGTGMTTHSLQTSQGHQDIVQVNSQHIALQIAQERLYSFLVEIVQKWPPEEVLHEFKHLFIDCFDSVNFAKASGIYGIDFLTSEEDFYHTIKRCLYIIVNNWEAQRKFKHIQELLKLFDNYKPARGTTNPQSIIIQDWLKNFIAGQDYKQLKYLTSKYKRQSYRYDNKIIY
jgi:hypothetical protein